MSRGTRSGGSADTAEWGKSVDTAVAAASGAADASQSRLVKRLVKSIGGKSCRAISSFGAASYCNLSCDGIVSIPFALPRTAGYSGEASLINLRSLAKDLPMPDIPIWLRSLRSRNELSRTPGDLFRDRGHSAIRREHADLARTIDEAVRRLEAERTSDDKICKRSNLAMIRSARKTKALSAGSSVTFLHTTRRQGR